MTATKHRPLTTRELESLAEYRAFVLNLSDKRLRDQERLLSLSTATYALRRALKLSPGLHAAFSAAVSAELATRQEVA